MLRKHKRDVQYGGILYLNLWWHSICILCFYERFCVFCR